MLDAKIRQPRIKSEFVIFKKKWRLDLKIIILINFKLISKKIIINRQLLGINYNKGRIY